MGSARRFSRQLVVLAFVVGSVGSLLAAAPVDAWVPPPAPPGRVLVGVYGGMGRVQAAASAMFGGRSREQVADREGATPRGDEGVVFDGPGVVPEAREIGSVSSPGPIGEAVGDPVEIVSARSATGQVFDNGNGTVTVRSYTTPRFFETEKGAWEEIDNTIVADKSREGWLVNAAGAWRVAFGPIDSSGVTGGVEIRRGELAVRVTPLFVAPGRVVRPETVEKSPDTVIYRDVVDGVDLRYRMTPVGVKEDVVVRFAQSATSFSFAVHGAAISADASGVLRVGAKAPATVLPLVVTDNEGAEIDPATSKAFQSARVDEERSAGSPSGVVSTLTVGVDPEWLARLDDRAFPVLLDPGFVDGGDTWQNVWSNGAGTFGANALGAPEWNYAGNQWSGGTNKFWRGFIRFPQYQTLAGQVIVDAKVWAGERSGNASASVSLYAVDGNTGTWSFGAPSGSPIGTQTINSAGTNVSYDVTALVQAWVNTVPVPQKAFVFVGTETAGVGSKKALESWLDITYAMNTAPPAATTNPRPVDDGITMDDAPVLSVDPVTDADAGDTVEYRFVVDDRADFSSPALSSAWLSSPSYTAPSGALDAEIRWFWRVETRDNHGAVTVPSTGFALRRTALGYQGFGGYFKGLNTLGGNYVFSETDAEVSTVGPKLALSRTFNTQDSYNGVLGRGWSTPYFMEWALSDANVVVTYPDGRREVHTPNGSGGWTPPAGTANQLTGSPSTGFTLSQADNSVLSFAAGTTRGRLSEVTDSYGRDLTIDYTNFSSSPQRVVLTDVQSGRSLTVKVTGTLAEFRITAVEAPNPAGGTLTWTYGYDTTSVPGQALLISACDARGGGYCATYQWNTTTTPGAPRMTKVFDRKGQLDVELGYSTFGGRITSIKDALGKTTTFTYLQTTSAPYDIQVTMTDARSNVWRQDYTTSGQFIREYAPGVTNPWEYTYDSATKLRTRTEDPLGHASETLYAADLRSHAAKDALGNKAFRVFDSYGNLVKECDGRTADANADNLPDADTYCTIYGYGTAAQASKGLLRSKQRTGLAAETFTYTGDTAAGDTPAYGSSGTAPDGLVRTHTEPSGKVTTSEYSASGDLTRVWDNTGPGTGGATTRYEAEADPPVTTDNTNEGDPIGGASAGSARIYSGYWDNYTQFNVTVAAAGTYNVTIGYAAPAGVAHRKLTVNGATVNAAYSFASTGWAWSTQTLSVNLNAGSNAVRFATDTGGGSDNEVYYDYVDVAGTASTGLDARYTYDSLGRVVSRTDVSDVFPAGVTTSYTYDAANNQTTLTEPAVTNQITSVAHQLRLTRVFDANNNVLSSTASDLLGGDTARATSTSFDAADRPVTVTDAEGGVVEQRYDDVGNAVHTKDANGRWVRTTFNARNLPIQTDMLGIVSVPESAAVLQTIGSAEFDQAGRRTASVDARGQRIEYEYDDADRPTRSVMRNYRDDLPAGTARDVMISKVDNYNAAGMATSMSEGGLVIGSPLRTTTFVYDNQGRRVSTSTGAVTETLTYDTASRVSAKTTTRTGVAGGGVSSAEIRYSYDTASRVRTTTVENGTTDLVTETTYDTRGVVTTSKDPSGAIVTATADQLGRTWKTDAPSVLAEANGAAPTTVTPTLLVGYNTFGEATHRRDELSQVTANSVDRLGRVVSITYPSYTPPTGGAAIVPTESFTYDPVGNQTAHTDRRGQVTDYGFDVFNRPVTQLDPAVGAAARGMWSVSYDANGNIVSTADPTGATQTFTYDSMNRVRTRTDVVRAMTVNGTPITGGSYTTTVTHDDLGRLVRTVSPEGVVTANTVNDLGEITEVRNTANAVVAQATFDAWGNTVVATDGMGRQVRTGFDQAGRATSMGRYASSASSTPVSSTAATYDAAGRIVTATDGNGRTTTAAYDVLGRLTSVLTPVASGKSITTSYGYDIAGNLTRVRDGRAVNPTPFYADAFTASNGAGWSALRWASGVSAGSTVDVQTNAGRLALAASSNAYARAGDDATSPRNAHSTHADAQLTATVKPSAVAGGLTTRLWMRASGTWNTTNGALQQDGYALRLSHASNTAAIVETVAGTETVLASVSFTYTANTTYKVKFQTVGTTLRAKIWVSTGTEPGSWTVTTTDTTRSSGTIAVSASVGTNSAARNVVIDDIALTPAVASGTLTAYDTITTYNTWGLPESVIEAATGTQANLNQRTFTRVYDAGGLPTADIAPDGGTGITVASSFDELGRLATQAAAGLTKTFGYDPAGRPTAISLPTGATQTFTYDDRSLLVGATGNAGNLTATFNGDRQLASRNDDAGTATFTYNSLGQLATTGDASTGQTLNYAYNNAYQVTRIDYGTPGTTTPYRTYGYDTIGRKTSDVVKVNTTTKYDAGYTYDGNDNVLTETVKNLWGGASTNETYTYTYDWSNRLTSDSRKIGTGTPVVTNHTYDDAGNRTSAGNKTWTYDQRGRITCGPDGTYTWDPRGALDRTVNPSNVTVDYTFDGYGRLTGYTGNGSTIAYTYDALDRIHARTNTTSGVTTTFTYSGTGTAPAATSASTGNRSYSRDPDGNVIGVKSGATARFAGVNRHTDLRFLFDTGGTVTDTRTYDPTGNVLSSTGTTGFDLGYQSGYTDPTSQQVWMAARWYNPATATFQSRDSYSGATANPISLNRYTYAASGYLNATDPTGRWHTEIDWAGLDACAAAGITCDFISTVTVPDPGDSCGIGAIYGLDGRTCVVVCDAACFQYLADQAAEAAYIDACLNNGQIIVDGQCVAPYVRPEDCPLFTVAAGPVCRPWTAEESLGVCRYVGYTSWADGVGCFNEEPAPYDPCGTGIFDCSPPAAPDTPPPPASTPENWPTEDPCIVSPYDGACGSGNACPWYGCTDLGGDDICVISPADSYCGGGSSTWQAPADDGCSGFWGCIASAADTAWDATGGQAVTYVDEHKAEVAIAAAVVGAVACAAAAPCAVAALAAINSLGAAGAATTSAVLVAGSGGALTFSASSASSGNAGHSTQLYRAVEPSELRSISQSGHYSLLPGQEGKYFFPTSSQAGNFAQMMTKTGAGPFCLTSACLSSSSLAGADRIQPIGEGSAWFVPESILSEIGRVTIHGPIG